jgi:hypothetical protein
MEDIAKKLRLMRFWLFGAYVIILVAFTVYAVGVLQLGAGFLGEINYWLTWIILAVLFVAAYYGYKWYLNRSA